ncbi:MAG: polyamine ABC transporter substrate-binding protein [Caldilineaceae bacterium]|nr:polyamine ABC transporter substrate-binding protein [Caldilineaceae bacterium]
MRKWLTLCALLSIIILAAACAAPADSGSDTASSSDTAAADGETSEGAVLRLGINAADLSSLDPHFASGTQDRTVVSMVFNGLVRYSPGDAPNIEPDLATAIPEPEATDDGKQVWTFELRQGVMCHAGPETEAYELTADDVVYSLQKSANPDRSAFAGEYDGMTVEKVDDYTVSITMDTPLSPVLFLPKIADYAGGFIVCSQAIEAVGDEAFKTHPVGTGPFMFESYTPQDRVVLTANPDYFRGAPKLAGVEGRYMPDISSRELGLRAGELDVIHGLDEAQWVDAISGEEGLAVDVFGVGEVATIYFNIDAEPFDKPEVRKAIAYALNRDAFLALFGPGIADNVYSPVPAQFMDGGLTKDDVDALDLEYAYDPEMARELLAEAGLADGFSFPVVSSEMNAYRKVYEAMQAQLAEVGIDMQVDVVDHSSMHSLIRDDANPVVVYVAFRPNADVYLTRFFHSDSIVVTGAKPDTNFSHYAAIDDLIDSARAETDEAAQIELWKEAQVQILEDMVAYPLMYQNQIYARSDKVDYGHPLNAIMNLNPQITEMTTIGQ